MRVALLGLGLLLLLADSGWAQPFDQSVYYHVIARHSGKCLDVKDVSPANGATMQQWDCGWPQPNQFWLLEPAPGGTYRIVSGRSAKCLDIPFSSMANEAVVQQWECNLTWAQDNQVFHVTPAPTSGYFRISAAHTAGSPKCLDVQNFSTSNGASIQQWDCGPPANTNQDWTLLPASTRIPRTHVQLFGYYGEWLPHVPEGDDHSNLGVFTWANRHLIPQAAQKGVKANLNIGSEFFRLGPRRDDYFANGACPGPLCDGGILPNYHTIWANMKTELGNLIAQGTIGMIYLFDEPYSNMSLWGFDDLSETAVLLQSVAALIKTDFPSIPIGVVESPPKVGVPFPSNIDLVGFDCYTCTEPQYLSLHAQMLASLHPNQGIIVVPHGAVDHTPNPYNPWPPPIFTPPSSPAEHDLLVEKAHFYINLALSEPRTRALLVWHGDSRPLYGVPGTLLIGTYDIPPVLAKWRFLARALGFGLDMP